MKMTVKGSMTIVLSLLMILFLTFCMVLLEGVRNYFLKLEAEQAMELAEFSILSEYQRELKEHWKTGRKLPYTVTMMPTVLPRRQ